jgi:hypothetical protein
MPSTSGRLQKSCELFTAFRRFFACRQADEQLQVKQDMKANKLTDKMHLIYLFNKAVANVVHTQP